MSYRYSGTIRKDEFYTIMVTKLFENLKQVASYHHSMIIIENLEIEKCHLNIAVILALTNKMSTFVMIHILLQYADRYIHKQHYCNDTVPFVRYFQRFQCSLELHTLFRSSVALFCYLNEINIC